MVCTVVFVGNKASTRTAKTKATSAVKASKASLTRKGRTYATGSVGHLKTKRKLVHGGYSLRVKSGSKTTIYRIALR